jgi:hypothetical protein
MHPHIYSYTQIYIYTYIHSRILSISLPIALQPFRTLVAFSVSYSVHSRYDSLDGGSAHLKAATYTRNNTNRINAHRHPCLELDSNARSQCSRGGRRFVPQTAWPLWSASLILCTYLYIYIHSEHITACMISVLSSSRCV